MDLRTELEIKRLKNTVQNLVSLLEMAEPVIRGHQSGREDLWKMIERNLHRSKRLLDNSTEPLVEKVGTVDLSQLVQ